MDERTLWAIMLIGLAIVLFILEVLIPSGGLLGLIAALSMIGGVIVLFWINTTLGLVSALVCLIAIPFAIAAMMKLWPNTPLFRALVLKGPGGELEADDVEDPDGAPPASVSKHNNHAHGIQVGDEGTSESSLRPVGMCRLNGRREECIADGPMIAPGKTVRVTHVDGMQIKVRVV